VWTREEFRPVGSTVFETFAETFTSPGALGFASSASDAGTDLPISLVEVPFAGWRPTTGETIIDGVPVGMQLVQFTAAGEIALRRDFGNVQWLDIDITAPNDAFEGDTIEVTADVVVVAPDVGLEDFEFFWTVTADNGDVIDDVTGLELAFVPFDNGIYTARLFATTSAIQEPRRRRGAVSDPDHHRGLQRGPDSGARRRPHGGRGRAREPGRCSRH
jgi:hypothetical protein